jgi:hypothetical protein
MYWVVPLEIPQVAAETIVCLFSIVGAFLSLLVGWR